MELKIKKDDIEIDIDSKNYLRIICDFQKETIKEAIKKVKEYKFLDNKYDKKLWALFGKNEEFEKWVCLEVGSSQNIRNEIVYDLKLMVETPYEVSKDSAFYKDVFKFRTYSDRQSCKYRAIIEMYKEFCWCEIDVSEYVDIQDINSWNTINYAEVKFAFETKAIFWNPAPATYGNQEKEILNEFINNANI